MKIAKRIYLTLFLLATFGSAVEVRIWTDLQGRKVEATLVKVEDGSVILKLNNGNELPYLIDKLSVEDRKYVAGVFVSLSDPKKVIAEDALNFDHPWPERITFSEDPEVNTVTEDTDKKRFIYESANYRYVCNVRLASSVVKGFAVMFETTHLYCRSLPLALNEGKKDNKKHEILLFEYFEDYVKAGGPPSSSGAFVSGLGVVMVPLTSLGVKPVGSGYMLDRDKSSDTLAHELTHQLTPANYYGIGVRGWFSEGLAEYVSTTPYRAGSYNVRGNQKAIIDSVTGSGSDGRGGRNLGTKIHLSALKTFMLQDYRDFTEQSTLNYGCGLLITNYFFHMDGDGDAKRIKAYLKALQEDKDAVKSLEYLLDGRSFEKLEEDITKAWGRKGIDFTFGN